jgi:hypothetical protein
MRTQLLAGLPQAQRETGLELIEQLLPAWEEMRTTFATYIVCPEQFRENPEAALINNLQPGTDFGTCVKLSSIIDVLDREGDDIVTAPVLRMLSQRFAPDMDITLGALARAMAEEAPLPINRHGWMGGVVEVAASYGLLPREAGEARARLITGGFGHESASGGDAARQLDAVVRACAVRGALGAGAPEAAAAPPRPPPRPPANMLEEMRAAVLAEAARCKTSTRPCARDVHVPAS